MAKNMQYVPEAGHCTAQLAKQSEMGTPSPTSKLSRDNKAKWSVDYVSQLNRDVDACDAVA